MEKDKRSIIKKMGEFIFGKTIVVQNSFFGEMIDAGDIYECRKLFNPIGKEVEIGLVKKEIEPDEKQIDFFKWIENNYGLIVQKVSPIIEKRVAEWVPNYQIKNFEKEFILEYLFIPKCENEIFEWQISFYADNELQHSCSLDMKGLEVIQILIEG